MVSGVVDVISSNTHGYSGRGVNSSDGYGASSGASGMKSGAVARLSRTERLDGDAAPKSVLLLAKKRAVNRGAKPRESR